MMGDEHSWELDSLEEAPLPFYQDSSTVRPREPQVLERRQFVYTYRPGVLDSSLRSMMSRSERYIPPSPEALERMRQAEEARKQFQRDRLDLLRAALNRVRKADLIELTVRIAQEEKASEWMLEKELGLDKPIDLLVHDIETAIEIGTKVDELRLNYNFDYDWRAYEAIHRGLSQLIEKEAIEEAKSLALTLADKGSYQMECTDEGLMHEEIESCLRVVISAVSGSRDVSEWALEILRCDRSGFLCEQELRQLAGASRNVQ